MDQIEIRNLSFAYPGAKKKCLEDVSFSIEKGEYVLLCGNSGCGKTTLLRHLKSVLTPTGDRAGEIFFNGCPMDRVDSCTQAASIGYVMQNPNQMISKTMIFEEVALALQGSDMTQEQIRQRVEDTLKVCGLYPFRNWPVSALSFGQKKRVTIASVLVQQPELIILDEPTVGLDPIQIIFLAASGCSRMSKPPIFTVPSVGERHPVIMFIVVDFPAPFGPRKP